jgi:hypothetical protein
MRLPIPPARAALLAAFLGSCGGSAPAVSSTTTKLVALPDARLATLEPGAPAEILS